MSGKFARDPADLEATCYDLIIIGGGIYGVMLCFEATKRGLKSLLLEKTDFCGATSANSLRIIHGGLRYLQSVDLPRFKDSVAERTWFLRTFPMVVKPLPFLMPLYGRGLLRPSVLSLALRVNDMLSRHRNNGIHRGGILPNGRVIGVGETIETCPAVDTDNLKGGAVWHDAYMLDPEQIFNQLLAWSCENEASVLNNLEAEDLLLDGNRVEGVSANDYAGDRKYKFKSRVVINAAGPWSRRLAGKYDRDMPELFRPSIAWNVLFNKPAISSFALAVPSGRQNGRTYFLLPLKSKLLAGTGHGPWHSGIEKPMPEDALLDRFIEELNLAVPSLNVSSSDIQQVFAGLLPVKTSASIDLSTRPVIIQHHQHGGPEGLYSVSGVKFTTSRCVADKLLSRIFPGKKVSTENANIVFTQSRVSFQERIPGS
jgi:glycerol-3-phosphate dehydrogenase